MLEGFVLRDGIYHPAASVDETDPYRAIWNQEADQDAVYSATGVVSNGQEDYATLTVTRQPLWTGFPRRHFGTILEIGCGYGRVPLILSREQGVTCDRYIGVDIAANMLARFQRYRTNFDVFPGADVQLVCSSAEKVPLQPNSIDLVISSSVFLHMGKHFVRDTFQHVARALRPGGSIVFDTSFPNACSIGMIPVRLYGWLAPAKPNRVKHYSRRELDALMQSTGLSAKVGSYTIEPTVFAVVPSQFRTITIPLAARLNRLFTPPPRFLADVVATMYSIHSPLTESARSPV